MHFEWWKQPNVYLNYSRRDDVSSCTRSDKWSRRDMHTDALATRENYRENRSTRLAWKFIFHHVCKCLFWNSFGFSLYACIGYREKKFITLKILSCCCFFAFFVGPIDFLFLSLFPPERKAWTGKMNCRSWKIFFGCLYPRLFRGKRECGLRWSLF